MNKKIKIKCTTTVGTTMGPVIGYCTHQIGGSVRSRGHVPMECQSGTAQCHKGFDVQCTRIKIYPIGNSLGMMPLLFKFPTASHQCCTLFGTIQQLC